MSPVPGICRMSGMLHQAMLLGGGFVEPKQGSGGHVPSWDFGKLPKKTAVRSAVYYHDLTVEGVRGMSDKRALLRFRNIGPKTARHILMLCGYSEEEAEGYLS